MFFDPLVASPYRPLPEDAAKICEALHVPPRLVAHLILVHDVACRLIADLRQAFPALQLDTDSILFGAATHDIGKAVYFEELSAPGRSHEEHGPELLQQLGVPADQARFASTHAGWEGKKEIALDDLLVALADSCWKGKRVAGLEQRVVHAIARTCAIDPWQAFAALDDILQALAADADRRLAWQAQFPAAACFEAQDRLRRTRQEH